jgi:hypothetical protein
MKTTIAAIFVNLLKFLAARELNSNVRTIIELYNEEEKLISKISEAHGSLDFSPDGSYILQLKHRLEANRNIIKLLEAKTLPSSSE